MKKRKKLLESEDNESFNSGVLNPDGPFCYLPDNYLSNLADSKKRKRNLLSIMRPDGTSLMSIML